MPSPDRSEHRPSSGAPRNPQKPAAAFGGLSPTLKAAAASPTLTGSARKSDQGLLFPAVPSEAFGAALPGSPSAERALAAERAVFALKPTAAIRRASDLSPSRSAPASDGPKTKLTVKWPVVEAPDFPIYFDRHGAVAIIVEAGLRTSQLPGLKESADSLPDYLPAIVSDLTSTFLRGALEWKRKSDLRKPLDLSMRGLLLQQRRGSVRDADSIDPSQYRRENSRPSLERYSRLLHELGSEALRVVGTDGFLDYESVGQLRSVLVGFALAPPNEGRLQEQLQRSAVGAGYHLSESRAAKAESSSLELPDWHITRIIAFLGGS